MGFQEHVVEVRQAFDVLRVGGGGEVGVRMGVFNIWALEKIEVAGEVQLVERHLV
jgi:hypothetical protein